VLRELGMWRVAAKEPLTRSNQQAVCLPRRNWPDRCEHRGTGPEHALTLWPFYPWPLAGSLQSPNQRTYFVAPEYGLDVSTLEQVEHNDWQVVVSTKGNRRGVHDFEAFIDHI